MDCGALHRWLLPTLLLWIASQHMSECLDLVILPRNQVVKAEGQSVVLNCMALGQGPDGMTPKLDWILPNGNTVKDTFGRISIQRGHYTIHLYLRGLKSSDAGQYKCRATGQQQVVIKELFTLINVFLPITYVNCPHAQQLEKHKTGLIQCLVDATPALHVSWKFKGRYIYDNDHYFQNRQGLRIQNVTERDAGMYTCTADVYHLAMFKSRDITVHVSDG